ncbi:MAG: flagellar hook-length control protein FliK [Clostridiaceae bacterium]|nr:flagellar hook-length control protein FliK [Clostridiaceae bacterium]
MKIYDINTGAQWSSKIQSKGMLAHVKIGDTLRVQVAEQKADLLYLRLPDGTLVSAASNIPLDIKPGDYVYLKVKSKTDFQTYVEIVKEGMADEKKSLDIKENLLKLQLIPDSKNIRVASEMIKNNIPITREAFQKALALLNKYNQADLGELLFLHENEIPVTEKNIALFHQYIHHKLQLGEQLETLMEKLANLENSILTKENLALLEPISHFKDQISALIKKIDSSKLESLHKEIDVSKSIKQTIELLEDIKSTAIQLKYNATEDVLATIRDMEEGLGFLNQLNKFTTFVQIPLNINDNNTTAELYVFRDGRSKKKIDPSNATFFISLSTANLGLVEAFVIIYNKNIECNFQAEERETVEFIKDNILPLYEIMEAHGYKLVNVSYKLLNERINIMNAAGKMKQEVSKESFDVRV